MKSSGCFSLSKISLVSLCITDTFGHAEDLMLLLQEMQADMSSKTGRVSDATMLKLCRHVMGRRDPQWKGFILEGWPKTPDQAEQLFTEDQPYS